MSIARDARFWDKASRKYARATIGDPAGYERTLVRTRAVLRPGDHVLELGCGTGSTALRLGGGVASYVATDISAGMIGIANEKLAEAPVPGLAFRVATAEDMAAEAGRFDAVLAFNYLHMVRDVAGTLAAIRTVLRPGGHLVTKTPCLGDMNPLIRGIAVPVMQAVGKAPHVTSFRADALAWMIEAAGFEILAVERHGSGKADHRPFILARKG
ncbi:class I SAM-dependent methyltransferase [Acuticoccus kandeliae]|uniref:class I SAM-dependent methyltransferase n=1 Tax=Acuticoccus kandeliae TaxID=2073160 RepID=UPI000D3EAA63|nr:class I SAM-dependent methyltransferase [Acuticoccus kandeliae]